MTPHMEALAYRIWAYATPREWDCSYAEIADGTGISYAMVAQVISAKGWQGRVPHGGNASANRSAAHATIPDLSEAYASRYRNGENVDPNLLAVDQLMR